MLTTELTARLTRILQDNPHLRDELTAVETMIQDLVNDNQCLESERDRYRSYVENASDTIAEYDKNGKIIYTTKNWIRQLGYTPQSVMVDDFFTRLFHPDDAPRAIALLREAISSKEVKTDFEYRIKHADGQYRWHTANLSPILDEDGKLSSVVAIAHSIHKRKTAEISLKEREELQQLLLSTMREGVIMVDNDDNILYINPYCCELFGIKKEDAIGQKGYELLLTEDDHEFLINKNRERTKGISDQYELRGKTADGRIIWLRINGAPIHDQSGEIIGSVGIMTDITTQKCAVLDLKRSEESYRLLFENAVVGVFQSTMDDHYLKVNKAFAHMFGYSSPEAMLSEVKDIKDLYVDPAQRLLLKDLLFQKGEVESFECELYKKNKEKFWVSMYVRLSTDSEGRTIMEGTNLDITESKSLREQLLSSQKMDAIGKLAGGIAHDFNNLLTVILGYSEDFLDELSEEDPLYEPAQEIVTAGMKAANLTRQLLAFSRKQLIHNHLLDCNSIIRNLQDIIIRLAGEDTKIRLFLAEDLKNVKADPGQMEQMLINLILNAREAMPTGGEIAISTQNLKVEDGYSHRHGGIQTGEYVQISVADTGIGIEKALQEKVFEPFFTTKTDAKGLGLSTSWGVVKQFDGHINLYSELGRGTRINILIPVCTETHSKPKISLNVQETDKPYIMVVENEAALCQLLNRMLTNLGYKVRTFIEPKQALQKIKKGETPDLLITDVVMPEMDGKQLADEVSRISPGIKILFMSGFADDIIAKHGVWEDSSPLIQKPFSAKEIAPVIEDILSGKDRTGRLLIMDDDVQISKILQRSCIKHGFSADCSEDLSSGLLLLKNNDYDILIIDVNLGEMQGRDALKIIRDAGFDQPAILLSGMIREADGKDLDTLGVVGLMEKSFDHQPLMDLIRKNLR